MHLQWFQHTARLLSLLHPAGLITSKRKKHSKHWQHFHRNSRACSIGCQHPTARQSFVWSPGKAPVSGAYQHCQQSSLLAMWFFHDQLFNLVLYWINNALHSCLKGKPAGNGASPRNKQSPKHRRAPCDGTGLTALTVHPQPLGGRSRSVQQAAHPTPWAADTTLHRLLPRLQGAGHRAGAQTQHPRPHLLRAKAAHALFSTRTGIHLFVEV